MAIDEPMTDEEAQEIFKTTLQVAREMLFAKEQKLTSFQAQTVLGSIAKSFIDLAESLSHNVQSAEMWDYVDQVTRNPEGDLMVVTKAGTCKITQRIGNEPECDSCFEVFEEPENEDNDTCFGLVKCEHFPDHSGTHRNGDHEWDDEDDFVCRPHTSIGELIVFEGPAVPLTVLGNIQNAFDEDDDDEDFDEEEVDNETLALRLRLPTLNDLG